MKNLYYIEYGCSICTEHLIVLANDKQTATDYAYQEAQDLYYSYDCNYPNAEDCEGMDEDDIAEMMQEDMEQDINYLVVIYNPKDEEHLMVMHDQNDKPHEI